MAFFWNKQKKLQERVEEYLKTVEACTAKFCEGFQHYLEQGRDESFVRLTEDTRGAESKADDVRRSIELELYAESLIPAARGDTLQLLEYIDRVPNQMECVLISVRMQQIDIPAEFAEALENLLDLTRESVRKLIASARQLFEDLRMVREKAEEVSRLETDIDQAEQGLISAIFQRDFDTGTKILLRDVVQAIAGIADRAEDAAFYVELIAVKRML